MKNLKKTKQNSVETDSYIPKETRRISRELFSGFNHIYPRPLIKSFLRANDSLSKGSKSGICKMRILLALNLVRIYFPNSWLTLNEIIGIIGDDLVSESSNRRYLKHYVSEGRIEKKLRKRPKWGKVGRPTNEFKLLIEKNKFNGLIEDDLEDRPPNVHKYLMLDDLISPDEIKEIDSRLIENKTYDEIATESLKLSGRFLHKSKERTNELTELIYYEFNEVMTILGRIFELLGVKEHRTLSAACKEWKNTPKSVICSNIRAGIHGFTAKELDTALIRKNPKEYRKFLHRSLLNQ